MVHIIMGRKRKQKLKILIKKNNYYLINEAWNYKQNEIASSRPMVHITMQRKI